MKPLGKAVILSLGLLSLALPTQAAHRYRRPSPVTLLRQKTQALSDEIDLLKMRVERLEQLAAAQSAQKQQAEETKARPAVGPEEITYP
jgi:Tfp pilus assembly protein PilN